METVALFGCGKIGHAICALLTGSGRYRIKACDIDPAAAKRLADKWPNTSAHTIDLKSESEHLKNDAQALSLLDDCTAVVSALPYFCNRQVANLAKVSSTHYLDLTEDVESAEIISELAADADVAFVPQCGLAPGVISIVTSFLIRQFDKVDTVKMRVGALPIYPSNLLKYNLTWSTEGLINQCGNMCEVIDDHTRTLAFPLEGYERFSLDGDEYEAFNTSGGLGTLCQTLEGKVRRLDYKSIRYPGHCNFIAFLMRDLRFKEDRTTLKHVLERGITTTNQDKCIIFSEVRGYCQDDFIQKTYASTVYNQMVGTEHLGAIQITTAAGICAPLDLLLQGKIKQRSGFVRLEDIPFMDFLGNEFGQYYRDDKALGGICP